MSRCAAPPAHGDHRTGRRARRPRRCAAGGSLEELQATCRELAEEVRRLTDDDLPSTAPLAYGDIPVAVFSQIPVGDARLSVSGEETTARSFKLWMSGP